MKEIVVLSGKGGTGKTTIVGSLAMLMPEAVLADCDVDAADLHLILAPEVKKENEFWSGVKAKIDPSSCTGCGTCVEICHFEAIKMADETAAMVPFACEGCGVCASFCPEEAITLEDNMCGLWMKSETDYGPMIHARLGIAEENSGKLVSLVKQEARSLAEGSSKQWLLVDGPPGIGCPVIASLSGTDFVLLVTEPTSSGLHDLERVHALTEHFKIPAGVWINKFDLNMEMSDRINNFCSGRNLPVLGQIPFDQEVVTSLIAGEPLLKKSSGIAAQAIRKGWQEVEKYLQKNLT
ncbi:MAG: ATP-binding protein [Desulfobulbaceae bacterium]|nr:ATP-binding protein [Desulfobulbaceae bacterium]